MRPIVPVVCLVFAGSCSLYFAPPEPPPGLPISGGTLLVTRDGNRAVAADPEEHRVVIVDLAARRVTARIALGAGDEPGRVVEDGAGRIHVALRRGGAVVTIVGDQLTTRRAVCAAPRGLAWQAQGDLLHVACATGELVSLPAAGGAAVRSLRVERDLRDVVVDGDDLLVSRFRSAELLRVRADGTIAGRARPATAMVEIFDPETGGFSAAPAVPAVAWRTVSAGGGKVVMIHQRAQRSPLSTQPGGYGGGSCSAAIESTATIFDPATPDVAANRPFAMAALPVDVAVSPAGDRIAIAQAGPRTVRLSWLSDLPPGPGENCGFPSSDIEIFPTGADWGAPLAVAFRPDGQLVVQHDRALVVRDAGGGELAAIELSQRVEDAGRRRFHEPTFAGLACASCHPEGREDGLVWTFDSLGDRRTQDISGHLEDRAPYHWDGDMQDLDMLLDQVLVGRMGGNPLTAEEARALPAFLFSLPPPPPPTSLDAAAVARGRALFESAELACTTCHGGAAYTNSALADVGTGGRFKVPSLLGVGWRAPYIHTGCAPTLRDRFGGCGGSAHGATDTLGEAALGDLTTFLESL